MDHLFHLEGRASAIKVAQTILWMMTTMMPVLYHPYSQRAGRSWSGGAVWVSLRAVSCAFVTLHEVDEALTIYPFSPVQPMLFLALRGPFSTCSPKFNALLLLRSYSSDSSPLTPHHRLLSSLLSQPLPSLPSSSTSTIFSLVLLTLTLLCLGLL